MPIYKTTQKNKDGLTKYKVRYNYIDDKGKARQLTRVAYGLQEAKSLEAELAEQAMPSNNMSLDELFDYWQSSAEGELKRASIKARGKNYVYRVQPYLGKMKIQKITPVILNEWKMKVSRLDCSLTTKKNTYRDFSRMLNFAVKMDFIKDNPLRKVGTFKDSSYIKPEMQYYTPEEWQRYKAVALQDAIDRDIYDYYVFFCIAYYTGMRKGEIHALRWNCLRGNILSVKTSITQKMTGTDVETPPKNKSSIRDITIPSNLLQLLTEHRERQQRIPSWNENGFICGYYRPLRDSTIEYLNTKFAKAAGLKHIRIHDFRHSHASVLINAGVNPLDVAHRLGHSSTVQTLKTYSHLFPKETDKALPILEKI